MALHETSTDATADQAPVTAEDIEEAATDLRAHLSPTPLQYSLALSAKAGCHVYVKIEGIQPTRAFKVRGAFNKLMRLRPEQRAAGVITASAGNHGLGVAYAARAFRTPATVYVPEGANPLKVKAIKRMGSRVVQAGRSYDDAYREAVQAREASGAVFVHAFNDPAVVAGQGSIGVELLEQLPSADKVLVPVGGGGLIAGIAQYLKSRRPSVQVIGVEPKGANAMTRSLAAGEPVTLDRIDTMADGLASRTVGRIALDIATTSVDQMITVEEDEMLSAIRLYFECEHLLAEPAGAAALAALLNHLEPDAGEQVIVLLSGANIADEVMLRALKAR